MGQVTAAGLGSFFTWVYQGSLWNALAQGQLIELIRFCSIKDLTGPLLNAENLNRYLPGKTGPGRKWLTDMVYTDSVENWA